MKIIRIYDEVAQYSTGDQPGARTMIGTEEKLIHELKSDSKKVQAGMLRALADELDPPGDGKTYR